MTHSQVSEITGARVSGSEAAARPLDRTIALRSNTGSMCHHKLYDYTTLYRDIGFIFDHTILFG